MTALRYPGATYELLGPQTESAMRAHDIVCIHTMVGSLAGTAAYFEDGGFAGTESHFGTGGDGACIQWQDLAFSADANLDGWARVISIENADMGAPFPAWSGSNVPRFSPAQAQRLVDLLAWLCSPAAHAGCPASWRCHQEGIPLELVPDSKPGRRGIATHRQGVDGNFPTEGPLAGRVAGGERWSTSRGKACPGDRRILQLVDEIIPAARERLANQEEGTMGPVELARHVITSKKKGSRTVADALRNVFGVRADLRAVKAEQRRQRQLLEAIAAELEVEVPKA